jgi:hypothetical protein
MRLQLKDPVYVGLGVCSHDDNALETARFSEVELVPKPRSADAKPVLHSTLETIAIASKDRRAIYHTAGHFEAPNWSRDGSFLLFNSSGRSTGCHDRRGACTGRHRSAFAVTMITASHRRKFL